MSERVLIVNADDFGRSEGINAGVVRAHEEGIVTSASLMVRWPAAGEAAAYARRASLGVGLHLDLGEWAYREGEWQPVYEVVPEQTPETVRAEVTHQLERFKGLIGAPPTHLDSHQHVHRDEPTRTALLEAGQRLGVPVRHFTPGVTYNGGFFGQDGKGNEYPAAISPKALEEMIRALPGGTTELACHPAAQPELESAYATERVQELESLCHPDVRAAIEQSGLLLRSFAEVAIGAARGSRTTRGGP